MTTATEPIEGKVAQLLNIRERVINVGSDGGVKRGMKFAVLVAEPLKVTDPTTGALLGELDREKIRVQATEVHDKFSVCATYETITVGGAFSLGDALGDASALLGPRREVRKTLKTTDSDLPPPLSEAESVVKIGDRVKTIVDPTTTDRTT
jgi:hypothetical protein